MTGQEQAAAQQEVEDLDREIEAFLEELQAEAEAPRARWGHD